MRAGDIILVGIGALCAIFGLIFVILPAQELLVRPHSHSRGNHSQAISRIEALLDALIVLLLISGGFSVLMFIGGLGLAFICDAGYPPTWLGITKSW